MHLAASVDFCFTSFLEVSLDPFEPNMYTLNNNPVFEPSYIVCINPDLSSSDNRSFIGIKSFSGMNEKLLHCLKQTETLYLYGFVQTV